MTGWQHTFRRNVWRPQRNAFALGALGLFVAILIGGLYLSQSSSSSALGRELETLIEERNALEQSNEQLRAQIASLQYIPRLLTRAGELGFAPITESDQEYLVIDGYNPERARILAPIDIAPTPVPVYEESFSGWVAQQWDEFTRQLESFRAQGTQ